MNIRKFALLFSAIFVSACGNSNNASVDGKFFGNANKRIAIERILPGANVKVIDTLSTNSEGEFSFNVKFEDENPLFVNIRTAESYVPLLLSAGERVEVSSIGNLYNNYKVSGSEGSIKLHELNTITTQRIKELDSLSRLFNPTLSEDRAEELGQEYAKGYVQLKRDVIKFVVTNPYSLSTIVPLYQPMVDGMFIFNEPSDIVYFRAVADSLSTKFPESPYVISLLRDIENNANAYTLDSTLAANIDQVEVAIPEITLKDSEGKMRSLTQVAKDKVVLLDFTELSTPELKVRNAELAEVYNEYNGKGFEIFQVSINENRATWLRAVVDARLPWVSVRDSKGATSLRLYNVQKIPSNFLIDREMNIVAKDINSPKALEEELIKFL